MSFVISVALLLLLLLLITLAFITLDGTVQKELNDLVILGMAFNAMMTFEKLCLESSSSEAWYHEKVQTTIS